MGLDGCGVLCVYVLVLFNLILAGAGFASLSLGLSLRFSGNTGVLFEVVNLESWAFVAGVTVLIVLGSFMSLAAMFGLYGSCAKSRWALQTFAGLLGLLAGTELSLWMIAVFQLDKATLKIVEFYVSMYARCDTEDTVLWVAVKLIHKAFHCCGVTGVRLMEKTCPEPSVFLERIVMPNCPVAILGVLQRTGPFLMGLSITSISLLCIPLACSSILYKKITASVSTPQYTNITNHTLANAHPCQWGVGPTPCSHPEPATFPLLTVSDAPAVKAECPKP